MHKKAQITLFVIIGLLIVIGGAIIVSISSKENHTLQNTITKNLKQTEEKEFEIYVTHCVDKQIEYNLQNMFSNLFSTIYIQKGLVIGVIENKPIAAMEIVDETIKVYEEKLTIILKNSECLQNIPEQFPYSSINVENTKVTIDAKDNFIVETIIDGKTEKKGSITKLPLIRKKYGNIYKSDFKKTINSYIIVSSLCQSTICFPQIAYLLPPEMNITLSNRGLNHTNLVVERENAIVANKKVRFNIELIKK